MPGNMIMGAGLSGNAYFLNANQNPTLVLNDLQTCTAQYLNPSNSGNISVGHGHDWGVGGMGATLFNTIAPPNSTLYPWAACRTDCGGGCDGASMDYSNAQSYHPGGVNTLMADGSSGSSRTPFPSRPGGRWGPGTAARSSAPTATEPPHEPADSAPGWLRWAPIDASPFADRDGSPHSSWGRVHGPCRDDLETRAGCATRSHPASGPGYERVADVWIAENDGRHRHGRGPDRGRLYFPRGAGTGSPAGRSPPSGPRPSRWSPATPT